MGESKPPHKVQRVPCALIQPCTQASFHILSPFFAASMLWSQLFPVKKWPWHVCDIFATVHSNNHPRRLKADQEKLWKKKKKKDKFDIRYGFNELDSTYADS